MITTVLTFFSIKAKGKAGQNAEDCKNRHAKARHCQERHY